MREATVGRDADQLDADYPDSRWRARLGEIADLIEVLADCVIFDGYTIPDDLNAAIRLSPAGIALRDKLVRKEDVPAKEATLLCALTLGHDELFIDVDGIDIPTLERAIHDQVHERRIEFPLIFGRELYDRYAETYDDERDSLNSTETKELLRDLPVGVFQYGQYTTGPFGLRKAPTSRTIRCSRRVPAFHCSDPVCRHVHSVRLETSRQAPINKLRPTVEEFLKKLPGEPDDWWGFVAQLGGRDTARFGDHRSATLIPPIGDSLADDELALLVATTFNSPGPNLREAVADFIEIRDARTAVEHLNRAELLQIILFAREDVVARALDTLVRRNEISVPDGEVRRPVVVDHSRSGAFDLGPELGSLGVRFVSSQPGFPLLRLRRLLDKLYVRDVETDVEELEWQLRGIDVDDLDERLDEFYRSSSPRRIIERLALARKTNLIAACEEVGLEDPAGLADSELVDTLMWKFGFPIVPNDDPHNEFWRRHDDLWALVQSSDPSGHGRFLDAAAPYFSQLEGLLLESLAFSAWALVNDHTASRSSFTYDDATDRASGLALMDSISSSPAGTASYSGDKVDLGNLVGGFAALANHLSQCRDAAETYTRPPVEMPAYEGKTDLKKFALRSTVPFLDLTPPSQDRLVEGLRAITKLLTGAHVPAVRNDYAHYRRSAPEMTRLEGALEAIRQAVTRIETLGLACLVYAPRGVHYDEWGRSVHEFIGPRRYEHRFVRPTRFDWMGLPSVYNPAIIVRSAAIGEPTEVLRFERRFESPFASMWVDFPNRRRKQRAILADESADHPMESSPVGGVAPRQ